MNRNKNLPLTETLYYILLSLVEPAHGYAIMQRVETLSDGQVRLAAGTLYGAIENLLKKELITALPSDDPRRKVYVISDEGKKTLYADFQRMRHMLAITEQITDMEVFSYDKV
ncbi:PadR family transcriptional regulator [Konateibacter massiliensis]|uniref:PadR family transcriptional regulator n=1 Tax=Konateibacter massiliensis TaxID=2002841 RepID=UPI000C1567F3|nr:PadR family transcriptional regulator [Konateibacter massiliensis]